ncbi:hypothetical protein [Thalassolituus maritimus]|uniref:Porin n=1 Tax=Thalassolituus maritimus TaxID=484498 RepID=A0ABP9ZWP2_9GAMM
MTKSVALKASALAAALLSSTAHSSPNISGGVWFNYQYQQNNEAHQNSWGVIDSEALVLYADGNVAETPWSYSAEARFGPGSFTDPDNNSTGGQFGLHKAWVGYQFEDGPQILIGKSQVPFGIKTYNFWPGDMLLAGYGDQMDVGVKASQTIGQFHYDAAFYLADDWSTSTDTMDDNGHWGSTSTYRKVQTFVGNLNYSLNDMASIGLSAQSGGLQALASVANPEGKVSGDHNAATLYYTINVGGLWAKAAYITTERNLPDEVSNVTVENDRYAVSAGLNTGKWSFYTDLTYAQPDTDGNDADTIRAFAPGLSYDYGPGWMYLEYLTQDGYVDGNGQALEGDFDALYATIDFYF